MLVRDPAQRATAAEILSHEWLAEGGAKGAAAGGEGGAGRPGEAVLQPEILKRMRKFAGMNRFKKEALRVRVLNEWEQGRDRERSEVVNISWNNGL
jgi:hypothetical protein